MYAMSGRRFLVLADRLPAYGGVLSAIVKGEQYRISQIGSEDAPPEGERVAPVVPGAPAGAVPGTREMLERSPAFGAAPGMPAVVSFG